MKAFEKRFPVDKEWDWVGVPQDTELCNAMLETGWRAALEWVCNTNNSECITKYYTCSTYEKIKKELEGI